MNDCINNGGCDNCEEYGGSVEAGCYIPEPPTKRAKEIVELCGEEYACQLIKELEELL